MSRYRIFDRTVGPGDPDFADALLAAHARHHRPLCLCAPATPAMVVARLGTACVLKRMPGTGPAHAADCPSWAPPLSLEDPPGAKAGAIQEDPRSGLTLLRLDFPLRQAVPAEDRPTAPAEERRRHPAHRDTGPRLTLLALLHQLWHQAGLTRWHRGFAGRRHWGTVRAHLRQAASGMVAAGAPLAKRLYIPEVFAVDRREALETRRRAQWAAIGREAGGQALMVLIGELKALRPGDGACQAVVKHLPDHPFALGPALYRCVTRRFAVELALWTQQHAAHLVLIGTATLGRPAPCLTALALMPVSAEWLPLGGRCDAQLLRRLVDEGREFIGHAETAGGATADRAVATLTDAGPAPVPLWICYRGEASTSTPTVGAASGSDDAHRWTWHPQAGAMPPLPARAASPYRAALREAASA